jgi:hypothetical protein
MIAHDAAHLQKLYDFIHEEFCLKRMGLYGLKLFPDFLKGFMSTVPRFESSSLKSNCKIVFDIRCDTRHLKNKNIIYITFCIFILDVAYHISYLSR